MKIINIILLLSLLLCGCGTTAKVMRYSTETYTPTQNVEVLRTKPVNREYVELGEVSVRLKKSTEENAVALLVEKAKEMGADAIIIIGERSRGAVAMPVGSMIAVSHLREIYAVAIKYK